MICSAYFGELSEERKNDWNCKNTDPYSVLNTFVQLDGKEHDILDCGQRYFRERIQIDWGSFAWKCSEEKIFAFLKDHKSALPWLVESDEEMIKQVMQYIKEHRGAAYGVVIIEEY